jgi:3-mercaptopyruvate sulfurtransferase SseA
MGIVLAIATGILAAAEQGVVRVVSAHELAPRLGQVDVLDARSEGEFRRDHVPGARRVDWRDWAEQRPSALGRLLGDPRDWGRVAPDGPAVEERLRRLLPAELGPAPVVYCTGGVRSALLAVLLEARLGVPARNYDGSLWEWSADPRRPLVANGPEGRR